MSLPRWYPSTAHRPFFPRPRPEDPWGHEHGEDPEHRLGPDGHLRTVRREVRARMEAPPRPVRRRSGLTLR